MTRFLSLQRLGLLEALLLVGIASALHAQTITTFDVPNSTSTYPKTINSAGQSTGYYIGGTPSGVHGFLRQADGTLTSFDAPVPAVGTSPTAINSAGQIVGTWFTQNFTQHSFLRQPDGTFTIFDVRDSCTASEPINVVRQHPFFGGDGDMPTGVNAKGQITGVYGDFAYGSFLRQSDGTIICFGITPSGVPDTEAQAINARGQITGFYYDGKESLLGFLRERDGTIVGFDVPDSNRTIPTAINGKGEIAGYGLGSHGFLRERNGTIITFDPTGSIGTQATAINLEGQITGFYATADGICHGFLRRRTGNIETFDVPGVGNGGTFPQDINAFGRIVGYYQDANFLLHGFIRSAH